MAYDKTVYSPKRSISAGKLLAIADEIGYQLRYLQLGGMPFLRYADEVPKKGLTNPLNHALLVVGSRIDDGESLSELDEAIRTVDRNLIGKLLNSFCLPWFELYSSRFNYEQQFVEQSDIDTLCKRLTGSQHEQLQHCTTQYTLHNQAKEKSCGKLIAEIGTALANATSGLLLDYIRSR